MSRLLSYSSIKVSKLCKTEATAHIGPSKSSGIPSQTLLDLSSRIVAEGEGDMGMFLNSKKTQKLYFTDTDYWASVSL
jgi:hypothetical protein